MMKIDGSFGEGGGQIVRTALALSALTGKAFRVTNIRSGRKDAGLKAQHVHCVKALEKLCNAKSQGATLGSPELTFSPGKISAKTLDVDIGTAGSISLFLQAVLLPCCFADKAMTIRVTGGTDAQWAMPVDYLREVLVPQLRRFVDITVTQERRGYYPKGGGTVRVRVKPKFSAQDILQGTRIPGIQLTEQHHLVHVKGISHAAKHLEDKRVAERQAHEAQRVLAARLKCPVNISTEYADTLSPGSGVTLWAVFSKNPDDIDAAQPIILGADALGAPGKPSEQVGKEAAEGLITEIRSGAAADRHLADNLIPWLALFRPSKIRTSGITNHCRTNIFVVEKFLPVKFAVEAAQKIIAVK